MRIRRGWGGVHEHQMVPGEIVDEARRRVDHEGRARDDQHGRSRNGRHGGLDDALVEALPVHDDVGAHLRGARGARGHGIPVNHDSIPQ